MNRGDLTNEQWAQLEPLLPPQKPKTGRPNAEHRRMLNGMLWILRTGAPWRDLPEHYGPWRSVASRFYWWRESGVWDRALSALQIQANAEGRLDWEAHLVDATLVRAHPQAAGAKKSAGESAEVRAAALGYSQGGFSWCLRPVSRMKRRCSRRCWSKARSAGQDGDGRGVAHGG